MAIILIASLWLFQSILLESFYKQIKTQSLKDTANVIATSLEKLDSTSLKSLHQTINNLAVENEISVTVIDSTSSTSTESFSPVFSVIATQDNVLDMLSGFQLFQIYKSAAENEGEYLQHYQRGAYTMSVISDKENENSENDFAEWNDDEFPKVESKQSVKHGIPPFFKFGITQELLFAKIVNSNNGHEYLLLFDSIITPVHTTVRTLKIQLIIQSIIILIIAALSAKKLSKKISRPITV